MVHLFTDCKEHEELNKQIATKKKRIKALKAFICI